MKLGPSVYRRPRKLDEPIIVSSSLPLEDEKGFSNDLDATEHRLREILDKCDDVSYRRIQSNELRALLVFVDGLTDSQQLDKMVIEPLLERDPAISITTFIENELLPIGLVRQASDMDTLVEEVLSGQTAVLTDGDGNALLVDIGKWAMRAIQDPPSESLVRGPREGFTETISVNEGMLRRRLKTKQFKLESLTLGELSRTQVRLAYIDSVVKREILEEVRARVARIKLDVLLDSHFIEEMIEDHPFSPYPQIQYTERPDVVVASLAEGKVAILMDTTPNVLIVPFTFWGGFQAAEDYYERFMYTTPVRWVRFTLLTVSIFVTPIYVALVAFHPQLLPTTLLLNIASAREPSPLPTLVECLVMEFLFEGLREAGVRLPRAVGSAVSIVGGLVLGQAAVQAGLISAPVVIMVALGGIASFAIPRYNFGFSYRLLRFPVLFMAGILGLYGIAVSFLLILIHQVNLTSFGVPYFAPVAPEVPYALKDVVLKSPRWALNRRPKLTSSADNLERVPSGQRPGQNQRENER